MKASKGPESGDSQGLPGSTLGRIILLYLAVRCKHGRISKRYNISETLDTRVMIETTSYYYFVNTYGNDV